MEEVIDIRTLQCYQKATEEQRKKCTSKLSFEIGKLPTLKLQEEWTFYIKHCGEVKSLSSVRQETVYFKRVCEFMNHLSVDSMKVQTKAVWGQQFESWVSAQGLKAYRESNKNKNWRERTPIVLYFLHMLDFIDSEMSGQRIYFKDLACYQEASEEERKKCGREPYFDLSLLPTQQLRKEWGAYIKESARIYTLGTSFQHRVYYNQICRFLNSRIVCVKSMREQSKEKWEYQFKRWLMTEGIQINRNTDAGNRGLFSKQSVLDQVTIGAQKTKDGQVYKGFQGEISHVIITSETLTDADAIAISKPETSGEIASGSAVGEMFQIQYGDNSWVFTGGEAVQGGFAQTRGVRNYVGQFEEYVRWTKAGNENGRQRYTINTGKAGQTLKDVVDNYQTLVADYSPKAAAYLVGKEDYQAGEAGIASFQDSLRQFINLSLGLERNLI